MKNLGIFAFVLAAVAIGANLYAVIETLPNYEAMDASLQKRIGSINMTLRSPLR